MHQEHHVRKRHERDLFEQCRSQRVDGLLDELRPVIERDDGNTGRQAGLNLGDPCLDGVDHLFGVDARSGNDDAADGFGGAFDQ